MKRRLPMVGIVCVLVGAAGLAWLLGIHRERWSGDRWPTKAWGPGRMMGAGARVASGKHTFASNGEQIYYTGISRTNGPLRRTGGPRWVQHDGVGCVACHGVHGRGGVPVMMGTALPEDIRYATLTAAVAHEKGEMGHPPFTDATIQRAVTQGVDPANKPVDWTMPRWQLADEDWTDLLAYLKTLQ
jgi:cytochrome c oxidase subunit II